MNKPDIYSKIRTREIDGIANLMLVITQDYENGDVLMAAYANKEALDKTLETGYAHYYSTSRKKLWMKGETSNNRQLIKEIWVDCDGDALLYKVEQKGGAACHEGYKSCFFRELKDGKLKIRKKRIFNPKEIYF